jgi:hypothetical protein
VILSPPSAGLGRGAAIRMAISTARNVLAGIDGKLDPSMVVTARCCESTDAYPQRPISSRS